MTFAGQVKELIPSPRLPREREKESAALVVAHIWARAALIWAGMTRCSHTRKQKHIILTLIIYTTLCPDSRSNLCRGPSAAQVLAACVTPGRIEHCRPARTSTRHMCRRSLPTSGDHATIFAPSWLIAASLDHLSAQVLMSPPPPKKETREDAHMVQLSSAIARHQAQMGQSRQWRAWPGIEKSGV